MGGLSINIKLTVLVLFICFFDPAPGTLHLLTILRVIQILILIKRIIIEIIYYENFWLF
jgi:hypothetical protein